MSAESLKRHEALQPFSREHMGGLIQARNLQRAAAAAAQQDRLCAVEDFIKAWHAEIEPHFDDEERLLLPLIDAEADRARLVEEHHALRSLAARCIDEPAADAAEPPTMQRLGALLHDHIRWEERVLFELVQREHPEGLDDLIGEAHQIEDRRPHSRARTRLSGWPHAKRRDP